MTDRTGEDERLRIEAAQKDPRRFAELYEAHVDSVHAFILRRVRDRDAAEDLTADVFHHALRNLARYEWRGIPFSAWLFRIASNAISDRWERAARERGAPLPPPEAAEGGEDAIVERARLFRFLRTLPEDQRRVLELRFAEDRSIREIAAELGRTEGAVKQLQFRALENLRARMSESHG